MQQQGGTLSLAEKEKSLATLPSIKLDAGNWEGGHSCPPMDRNVRPPFSFA